MSNSFESIDMFETLRSRGRAVNLESSVVATSHRGFPTYLVRNDTGQEFLADVTGDMSLRDLVSRAVAHHPCPVSLDLLEIERRPAPLTPDITIHEPLPDEDKERLACPTDALPGAWQSTMPRILCEGVSLSVMGHHPQGRLRYFTQPSGEAVSKHSHWRLLKTVMARMPLLLEPDELQPLMAGCRNRPLQLGDSLKKKAESRAKAMLEEAIAQGRAPKPYTGTVYRRTTPLLKSYREAVQIGLATGLPVIILFDEDMTEREKQRLSLALERQDHGYLAVDDIMRNPFAASPRPENRIVKLTSMQYQSNGSRPAVQGQIAAGEQLRISLTVRHGGQQNKSLTIGADLLATGEDVWDGHAAYNAQGLHPKQLERALLRTDWDPERHQECEDAEGEFAAIEEEIQRQIALETEGPEAALRHELTRAVDRLHIRTRGVAREVLATSSNGQFTVTYHGNKGRTPA